MKYLILLLLPFTALCQTFKLENGKELIPVDVWSQMKQVNAATPQEIQVAAGIDYIFVLVEIPNNTTGKIIRIQDTATKPPDPTSPVLKAHVNDQGSPIVYDAGWQKIPASNAAWLQKFFNKDATLSYTVGSWASSKFTGRRIEVIAEKCDNHGKAKIEILKGTTVVKSEVVDMYQSTGTAASPATATNWCPNGVVSAIYNSGDLPLAEYTIRWSLESKNTATIPQRDSFVFDGYKVYE